MNGVVRRRIMGGCVLSYAAKIEYLQSSGTQYIDTGISPSTNFECEIKAEYIDNQLNFDTLLGSFTSANAYGVALAIRANNTSGKINSGYIQFGNDTNHFGSCAISTLSTLGLHTYKTSVKNRTISISVDEIATTAVYNAGNPSSLSMYMFARHRQDIGVGNYSKAKVYYCKIWNGGNLVFDAIPVRVGRVGYMYDRVSRKLFSNNGNGTFILGSDL